MAVALETNHSWLWMMIAYVNLDHRRNSFDLTIDIAKSPLNDIADSLNRVVPIMYKGPKGANVPGSVRFSTSA